MPKAQHYRLQGLPCVWVLAVVAGVLAAVVIGIVVWRSASQRVLERTGESLALSATHLADSLNRLLFEQARHAQMIAEAPVLQGQDHEEIARYLRALQHTNPSYAWAGVTDIEGRVVAASDGSGTSFEEGGSAWFQSVRQAAGIHIRELAQTEGVASLLMAVPLHDHVGQFFGAVVLQIRLTSFTFVLDEALRSSRLVRQGGMAQEYRFLGSDGTVLFDSSVRDLGRINLRRMGLPSAILIPSGRPGYVEETHIGRRVPVVTGFAQANGYATFPGLRWGITVSMDRADVVALVRRDLRRVALWGALGCLIVATFLVWTLERLRRAWITTKEREGWFSSLLKSMDCGVIATDSRGHVVFLNRAAQSMTGWDSREACGQMLTDVMTIVQKPTRCCEVTPVAAASRKDGLCFSSGSEHLVARDGSTLSVVSGAAPIKAPVGGSVVVCLHKRLRESAESDTRDSRPEGAIKQKEMGIDWAGSEGQTLWESVRHWVRLMEVYRVSLYETRRGEDRALWANRRYEWIGPGAIGKAEWSWWFSWSLREHGFSRWEEMLSAGQLIYGRAEEFPESEWRALSSYGVHTVVVVPVFVRHSWWGFIEFDHGLGKRAWTTHEAVELEAFARRLSTMFQKIDGDEHLQSLLFDLDAALEFTADGLLVVNEQGHVTGLNQRLLSMWDIPGSVGESRTINQILGLMKERLATPDALLRTISELDCQPEAESYDILELKDGRTIERFSRPKQEGDQFVGRVWSFHEVTSSLTPAPL